MRIHKKTLLFIILPILLLTFTIGMVIYIFILNLHVIIEDKSEQYNISYKDKKVFENYLNELGAFEKNRATLLGENNKFTLKKIHIVLTDIDNGRYSQLYLDKKTLASIKISGSEKDGTLKFDVYISPSEKSKSTDDLSNTGLFQILTGIRTTVGTKLISTQEVLDLAQKDIRTLKGSIPFLVTPQNNK